MPRGFGCVFLGFVFFLLGSARILLKPIAECTHFPMLGTADLALLVLRLTDVLLPFTLKQSQVLHQVCAAPLT